MKLLINSRLLEATNGKMALGVLTANVKVNKHSQELWEKITQDSSESISNFQKSDIIKLPRVSALRSAYQALGKSISKYKGSNESLLVRLKENKGLYQINVPVDINNLVSILSQRSIGSYDLDTLQGDIEFRPGLKKESYVGTTKRSVDLENLPLLSDSVGAFGSPTTDSTRALITEDTHRLMMVIFSFDGDEELQSSLNLAGELLERYAEARNLQSLIVQGEEPQFLNLEEPEKVDLPEKEPVVSYASAKPLFFESVTDRTASHDLLDSSTRLSN